MSGQWRCRPCRYAKEKTPEWRDRRNFRVRQRWREDPAFVARRRAAKKESNARHKERTKRRQQEDETFAARRREAVARYRLRHKERLRVELKQRSREDPEFIARRREAAARWNAAHPDRRKAIWRKVDERRRSTPEGILRWRISCQIRSALRRNRKKSASILELLGYTVMELRIHIENKFTDGMCWERFGEIHIDHIKPLVLCDLSTDEGVRRAWALENLQPLWAADNLRKHARYDRDETHPNPAQEIMP